MTAPADPDRTRAEPREVALIIRFGRVLLVMAGVVTGVVLAFTTGAVTVPGVNHGSHIAASPAAQRTSANQRWASALCTNVLAWRSEIHRDETSTSLGFGLSARLRDATAATKRLLSGLEKLGVPSTGPSRHAPGTADRLRSELQSGARSLKQLAETSACRHLVGIPF